MWAALRIASTSAQPRTRPNWMEVAMVLMVVAMPLVGLAVFGLQRGTFPHAQQMLLFALGLLCLFASRIS